jgi:hypothetical protein
MGNCLSTVHEVKEFFPLFPQALRHADGRFKLIILQGFHGFINEFAYGNAAVGL